MGLTRREKLKGEDVLAAIKTVDGAESGLDADLLDGSHADQLVSKAVQQASDNAALGYYGKDEVDTKLAAKAAAADLTAHTNNTTAHITAAERTTWNGKADAADLTAHTNNTTAHITAAERQKWNNTAGANHTHDAADISSGSLAAARLPTVPITKGGTGATTAAAALTALGAAAAANLTRHTNNTTVHITAAERQKWNATAGGATLISAETLAVLGLGDGATVNDALYKLGYNLLTEDAITEFNTSGTWTMPDKVVGNRVTVTLCGGGGGGKYYDNTDTTTSIASGGGGGGGYIVSKTLELTPGQEYTITIGAGGAAGKTSANGGNGGTTSFGSLLSANGGRGGGSASGAGTDANPAVAGVGGTGGTNGSNGTKSTSYQAAGGSGGSGLASKVNTAYTGAGGISQTGSTSINGTAPKQYGGGGQGGKTYKGSIGYTTDGDRGAAGGCILEYRVIKA